MFGDLLGGGPTHSDLNESNSAHAINYLGLAIALIEKGIITDEEYEHGRIQAIGIVDEEFAKKRDDAQAEFDKENPDVRKTIERILGRNLEPEGDEG